MTRRALRPEPRSTSILALRWLAGQLAGERHPLAHVPSQVAAALLEDPVAACTLCSGPLPAPLGRGRPRSRCERCSPPRRKATANSTVEPPEEPNQEEVA